MNRLRENLAIVPRPAWVIAVLVYAAFALLAYFVLIPGDKELSGHGPAGRFLFAFGLPVFLFVLVLLIGYVNGDARRRGMRYVMWTLLAIFVPNAIGIIIYFLLRDPLPAPCPGCRAVIRGGFTFCPNCGTALKPHCPQCGRGVEAAWANCPYCGSQLRSGVAVESR